jgi:hypothetical protein
VAVVADFEVAVVADSEVGDLEVEVVVFESDQYVALDDLLEELVREELFHEVPDLVVEGVVITVDDIEDIGEDIIVLGTADGGVGTGGGDTHTGLGIMHQFTGVEEFL